MNKLSSASSKPKTSSGPRPRGFLSFWRNSRGEAAVSFALVLPILLTVSLGILEMGLAMADRQRASEALRIMSRAMAISLSTSNVSTLSSDTPTACALADAGLICSGGGLNSANNQMAAAFSAAQAVFPRLERGNVVLRIQSTGLAPEDAGAGEMALVTVQFTGLTYDAAVFPLFDGLITTILFQTISNSLVLGG